MDLRYMKLKQQMGRALAVAGRFAASSYIAGPDLSDAERVCSKLIGLGWRTTICPWDSVGTPAREVLDSYFAALAGIKRLGAANCYLSIKLPSLDYDAAMTADLISSARSEGIRVHFDSLAPDTVDRSIGVLEKLGPAQDLGWTLPACWRRSLEDLDRLLPLRIPVRIVKGQWDDPNNNGPEPSEGFLRIVEKLSGSGILIGVATHDPELARKSFDRLCASGTPCELEQLFGLPRDAEKHAAAAHVPVRIYVPYSCGYLPYALSGMAANPRKCWWLLRDCLYRRPRYTGKGK